MTRFHCCVLDRECRDDVRIFRFTVLIIFGRQWTIRLPGHRAWREHFDATAQTTVAP